MLQPPLTADEYAMTLASLGYDQDRIDLIVERAAILEFDAGVRRSSAEWRARLAEGKA